MWPNKDLPFLPATGSLGRSQIDEAYEVNSGSSSAIPVEELNDEGPDPQFTKWHTAVADN